MSYKNNNLTTTIFVAILVGIIAISACFIVVYLGKLNNNSSNMELDNSTNSTLSNANSSDTSSVVSTETSSVASSETSSVASTVSESSSNGFSEVTPDNPNYNGGKVDGELVCYLTFDDGPCKNTDAVLKTLKDNNVKATFFVVGTMSTEKIKDIYNDGHAIGLHTNTHNLNEIYDSPTDYLNDIKAVSDVVYKKIGIRPNITRFAGGSATAYQRLGKGDFNTVKSQLSQKGYTYFDWNIDSGDTHSKSPSKDYVMKEIRKGLYKDGKLKDEVCVLMHDIKDVTVKALPDIIKELKDLGYTFKALDSSCENFAFK